MTKVLSHSRCCTRILSWTVELSAALVQRRYTDFISMQKGATAKDLKLGKWPLIQLLYKMNHVHLHAQKQKDGIPVVQPGFAPPLHNVHVQDHLLGKFSKCLLEYKLLSIQQEVEPDTAKHSAIIFVRAWHWCIDVHQQFSEKYA